MPPPASERPVRWRRFGDKPRGGPAAHAIVAAILVLAWRQFVPPNPAGRVIVELAPPAAQPSAKPAEPTFATVAADAGRAERLERADIDHPFAELTARGEAVLQDRNLHLPHAVGRRPRQRQTAPRTQRTPRLQPAKANQGPLPALKLPEPRLPAAQVGGAPIDTLLVPSFRPPGKKPPRTLAGSLNRRQRLAA